MEAGLAPRQIRARFDEHLVTVYQAYSPEIAAAAMRAGKFVAPFKRQRMTWIKPSFLWMMYRSAWATKPGQERVLAIGIRRSGFEWALANSCLSHYDSEVYLDEHQWAACKLRSPVRVQWDPERSLTMQRLDHRAIQIGLGSEAVARYVDEWIVELTDVTDLAIEVRQLVAEKRFEHAARRLPVERPYPLSGS
jgi:hypothetical protein